MTFRENVAFFIKRLGVKICNHKTIHTFSPEGKHCGKCGKLISLRKRV